MWEVEDGTNLRKFRGRVLRTRVFRRGSRWVGLTGGMAVVARTVTRLYFAPYSLKPQQHQTAAQEMWFTQRKEWQEKGTDEGRVGYWNDGKGMKKGKAKNGTIKRSETGWKKDWVEEQRIKSKTTERYPARLSHCLSEPSSKTVK
jgi:hypothetical protein